MQAVAVLRRAGTHVDPGSAVHHAASHMKLGRVGTASGSPPLPSKSDLSDFDDFRRPTRVNPSWVGEVAPKARVRGYGLSLEPRPPPPLLCASPSPPPAPGSRQHGGGGGPRPTREPSRLT